MKRELFTIGALTLAALMLILTHAQQTFPSVLAATEEPTKAPYIFPTPIFIPTFPPDAPSPTAAPNAPATQPAQPQPSEQTYTVQSGDSPWTIAQKVYGDGTKYRLILDANNLTTSSRLRVGSVLTIPALPGAQPAPIATATLPAATIAPPTLAATRTPTVTPTVAITPTLTPAPSSLIPDSLVAPTSTALTILGALLVIASLLAAALAVLAFTRARRFEAVESRRARIMRMFKR